MKKIILYIFLIIISYQAKAVVFNSDTVAGFIVMNSEKISNNKLKFDLYLKRYSDSWKYWVNGTFQFTFASNSASYKPNSLDLKYVPLSSQIPDIDTLLTAEVPYYLYKIKDTIIYESVDLEKDLSGNQLNRYPLRIVIGIVGPQKYINCVTLPLGDSLKLGTFILTRNDINPIDEDLMWLEPYQYYQASAHKLDKDSIDSGQLFGKEDDNIELGDFEKYFIEYKYIKSEQFKTIAKITGEYTGSKKIKLNVTSVQEYQNLGFIIVGGLKRIGGQFAESDYLDTISDYRFDNKLIGLGTSRVGKNYFEFYDTVKLREVYCYKLVSVTFDGKFRNIDSIEVGVPNSVIVESEIMSEHPFKTKVTIRYRLSDKCSSVTFRMFDAIGREDFMEIFPDNPDITSIGDHTITINAKNTAQQGLYELLILALPEDDRSVTQSKTVIDLQLLK